MSSDVVASDVVTVEENVEIQGIAPEDTAETTQADGRSNRKKKEDYPTPKGGFPCFPIPGLNEQGYRLQKTDEDGNPIVKLDEDGNEIPVLVTEIDGVAVVEWDYDTHKKLQESAFRNPLDHSKWLIHVHKPRRLKWFTDKQAEELEDFEESLIKDYSEAENTVKIAESAEIDDSEKDAYVAVAELIAKDPALADPTKMAEMLAKLASLQG